GTTPSVPGAGAGAGAGVEHSTSQRWRPTSAHGGGGSSAKSGRPRTGSTAPPPEESQSKSQDRKPARPVSQDGSRLGFAKAMKRTKAFSPDRLVKGLDSALDFVEGR
ncbi:hypothetical protein EVG20_g9738, partial [Dentipellis fragilis]